MSENETPKIVAAVCISIDSAGNAFAQHATPVGIEAANQPFDESAPIYWETIAGDEQPRKAIELAGDKLRHLAGAEGVKFDRLFVFDEHAAASIATSEGAN